MEKKAISTEQNKKVVVRWREERNKGNWNIINELFACQNGFLSLIQAAAGGIFAAIFGRRDKP